MKLILLLIVTGSLFSQNPFFIEQSHRVYTYLSYLESQGKITTLSEIKPFTSTYIKTQLFQVDSDKLSATEMEWHQSFENEFGSHQIDNHVKEIWTINGFKNSAAQVFTGRLSDSVQHLAAYRNGENYLVGQFKIQSEMFSSDHSGFLLSPHYGFYGKLNNFHFSVLKEEYAILGDESVVVQGSRFLKNSWSSKAIEHNDKLSSGDHSRGYLSFGNPVAHAWIGRIPFGIGLGESGKFVANGFQTSPFTSIGFQLDFWKLRYQGSHGSLTAPELLQTKEIDGVTSRVTPDKFMVSHRIELQATDHLQFFYNELVVYGNRSIDVNYLNPFSFLRPLEHELSDRDNALITLGFKYRIPSIHTMFYSDVLLDEWSIEKIKSYYDGSEHWWANKQAILSGITWANHGFQAWLEYTAIAPYVYSHKFPANRYSHDGRALGYELGPNSQTIFAKLAYQWSPELRFSLSHRIQKKGNNFEKSKTENWNIGGDLFESYQTRFKDTRSFLEGDLTSDAITELFVRYDPNHYINTELKYQIKSDDSNLFLLYVSVSY